MHWPPLSSPHIRNLPVSPGSDRVLAGGDGGGGGTRELHLPGAGLQRHHKAGSISVGVCGSVRSKEGCNAEQKNLTSDKIF